MPCEHRRPEGRSVDRGALKLFSKVAGCTGGGAAFRVSRIVGAGFRPGMRVLDIGTGPATIPLGLQRFYPSVQFAGLDISREMLQKARINCLRRKASLKLLAGDGEALPFADHSLQGVTSFFALHHMEAPDRFLKEVDRVLAPEGFLLIIDFRRDMARALFRGLDALWQLAFFLSAGRYGFRDSVRSAWRPDEINGLLDRHNLDRFRVRANHLELWITGKGTPNPIH